MAKKNYTQAGARRACKAINSKLARMHQDGYISAKQFVSLSDTFTRLHNKLK